VHGAVVYHPSQQRPGQSWSVDRASEPADAEEPEATSDEPDLRAETGAEAVDFDDLLGKEELEIAQRKSIEEAVQAALAAKRQKPQAQKESERDDRARILGAAIAGFAAGAIMPRIGARRAGAHLFRPRSRSVSPSDRSSPTTGSARASFERTETRSEFTIGPFGAGRS
jgi:hypothetical protein